TAFQDLTGWNILSDRRLAIYYVSEIGLGILLNLLMIIAGGGLMALAEGGGRLAPGVGLAKVFARVAMGLLTLTLVLPITMERTHKAFAKMDAQVRAGGAATPMKMTELARISAITGAITAVVGAVLACIYPALTLWFLTRHRARAACLVVSPKA